MGLRTWKGLNNMALNLKKRDNEVKKVLIYGLDGSGKSTFAEEYCLENNLNPIVIDIDDTNYTDLDIVEIDLGNDIKAYKNIKDTIKEIKGTDYDTIVLDGVSALLELLTPNVEGQRAYKVRADRWSSILQHLINSKKHLIFIGQADMEVIFNDEFQSPKPIIKVNSIVNEKYLTINEKGQFSSKLMKYRGTKDERPIKQQRKAVAKKEEIQTVTPTNTTIEEDTEIPDSLQKEICKIPKLKQAVLKVITDKEEVTKGNIILALGTQKGMNDELLTKLTERLNKILEG